MLTLLGFGSSARRGATGWTDRARLRAVIDTCQPDATVDGASPSKGADDAFHAEAVAHVLARGLSPDLARRCPMDTSRDGFHRGRYMNRNARQYREHRPLLAVGGVTGKVGSPLSSGSANMLSVCLAGETPTLVLRDNGIEPDPSPLRTMRRLHEITGDERLVAPWHTVNAWTKGERSREEVLAALAFVRDGSRWAPWIEAVEAAVRRAR